MTFLNRITLAAVLAAAFALPAAADGDAAKGETLFKKCSACHDIGDKDKVGPGLANVVGRAAGSHESYDKKYSKLNHSAGAAGLVWTEEHLLAYLADPKAFLYDFLTKAGKPDEAKGTTKMAFKLTKDDERADIVAYLKSKSEPMSEKPKAAETKTEEPKVQ